MPFYGFSVVCLDHPAVQEIIPGIEKRFFTYGFGSQADYIGEEFRYEAGEAAFAVRRRSGRLGEIRLRIPGRHNAYNALAAVAVASHLRVSKGAAAAALAGLSPPEFRMQVRRLGSVTVLDDCYNANPSSLRAALATLAATEAQGRRIAVLGDMLELGPEAERLHAEAGHYLVEMGVDELYTFGSLSRHLNQGARDKGLARRSAHHFSDFELMSAELAGALRPGDVVLVKASRGMRLERVFPSLRSRAGALRQGAK